MKKALMPILLILAVMILFIGGMYLYEQKWGIEGPFPNTHHHGSAEEELHEH